MNRLSQAQIEMLLGGYATGTLSREENDALMRAALENQALFDALMDEEALRETLSDVATRDELLRALRPAEVKAKWWQTPWPWAAVATAMVAVAVLVFVRREPPAQTAKLEAGAVQSQLAQARPEPVPSEIIVPKTLRTAEPARSPLPAVVPAPDAPRMAEGERPQQSVAPAAAPPPPQAPAPGKAEEARLDLAKEKVATDKVADAVLPARKQEVVTVGAMAETISLDARPVEPLNVVLAFQQQDGTWRQIAPNGSVPAGRALRLTVTSTIGGVLSTEPAVAGAQLVEPNRPATLLIAGRAAGDLSFRLNLNPAPLTVTTGAANLITGTSSRQNAPRGEGRAKARAAETDNKADSFAVGGVRVAQSPAPLATREIRLRIE